MNELILKEPGPEEAAQLAALLSDDDILRADLGMKADNKPTAEDVLQKLAEWCPPRNATTFTILVAGDVIGSISLSHRDTVARKAGVGMWLGSGYRRRGYGTEAFAAVLARAASEGIATIETTVATCNTPSRRMCERSGGMVTSEGDGKMKYRFDLTPTEQRDDRA